MLLGKQEKTDLKQVAILTRNPAVTNLLSGIIEDWGFVAVADPAMAAATFVERGMTLPEIGGRVVWLSPMPLTEGAYLEIPISLTRLYHMLEEEFFPSPRRHIRVTMNCPADLQVDGDWQESELISLSDRGGRLRCEKELSKGQAVTLETKLAGRVLRLQGEILYCIPAGDSPGREKAQLGVLFKPIDDDVCTALRKFIERVCVERARTKYHVPSAELALSWVNLVRDPWAELT